MPSLPGSKPQQFVVLAVAVVIVLAISDGEEGGTRSGKGRPAPRPSSTDSYPVTFDDKKEENHDKDGEVSYPVTFSPGKGR